MMWTTWLRRRLHSHCPSPFALWQQLLYPPTCLLCGAAGVAPFDLCAGCRADLPWLIHYCARCARALPAIQVGADATPARLCRLCQHQPPPYTRCQALFRYQEPIRHLIHGLKFHDQLAPIRLCGQLMAAVLPTRSTYHRPDYLVPVPLHPRRLRQRGYNQAYELARVMAAPLAIPINTACCQRRHFTTPQAQLDRQARRVNIRGAFQATTELAGCRVAVLDDVTTTGATVIELTQVLLAAGVVSVEVWALART